MRKTACKIIVLIVVLIMSGPSAFATSVNGGVNMTNVTSKTELEGGKTASSSSFIRTFNLTLQRSITPIVSYHFNLRTTLSDLETTIYDTDSLISGNHSTDLTTLSYRRSVKPTLELYVRNNIYDLTVGHSRQEQWSTAHYSNASKLTSEFYYSRFSVVPDKLPSIRLTLDRLKKFDHLPEYETYNLTNSYAISSLYALPSEDIDFAYNIVFSRYVNRTPLSIQAKSVRANFSNNYNIGYSDYLWNRKINYSAMYLGNYSRNRNRQYHTSIGSEVNIRNNNGGYSDQSIDEQLSLVGKDNVALTDGNLVASASIDLSSNPKKHIGVQILFGKLVDRLYIYVDEDISLESVLDKNSGWKVYKSSDNSYGSWTEVNINSVNVVYDSLNVKYRYEILFSSSQEAFYFKAVNQSPSNVPVVSVDVTEIQVLGTDAITSIGAVTTVSKSFSQGINLNAGIRPTKKLNFNFSYSIDRADQTPTSVIDSVSGIIENLFSTSSDNENENIISTVTRNYGASAVWQAHSLLTPRMNISRNEGFNNTGGIESSSNSYSLSMNYVPLSTVDTNLAMLRSDTFTNNEKVSTNDALLLSADTKLLRDVNMVTDIGFSRSKNLADDSTTSVRSINASLDANITRKMSGTVNYGYNTSTTGSDTSISKDVSTSINYQAGRLINFTGNVNYAKSNDKEDISEAIGVNWLPLPKIRLNVDYQHSASDGEIYTTKTDSARGYGTIYISKFVNVRVTFSYVLTDYGGAYDMAIRTINTNLNCRF